MKKDQEPLVRFLVFKSSWDRKQAGTLPVPRRQS